MTFKHTYSSYIGDAHERVVVCIGDTFADIVDIDAATEVRVLAPGKTKEDLDIGGGKFTQDTLALALTEAAAESTADSDAITLALSASSGAKVYVAVFINPPSTPTMTDTAFFGLIDAKVRQSDIAWSGAPWSTTAEPLREFKLTAKSFSASILGSLAPEIVFDGTDELDGVLDDSAWIAANVEDRDVLDAKQGELVQWVWRTKRLVSLTNLLDKMLEVTEAFMRDELSEAAISIARSGTATSSFTMYLAQVIEKNGGRHGMLSYGWNTSSTVQPSLGATELDGEPYVHFGLLDSSPLDKEVSWRRFKSMHSLLVSIAHGFGFFLQADWTSPTDLELSFVPRGEIVGNQVYLQDADKAERDYASGTAKKNFTGRSTRFAQAGLGVLYNRADYPDEWYSHEGGDGIVTAPFEGESSLALTVSATQMLSYKGGYPVLLCINPTDENGFADHWRFKEFTHTGIWFKEEDKFRQAYFVSTQFDGRELGYWYLSGLLNKIHGFEEEYFEDSYDITVPSLTAFSPNSSGANRSWEAVTLGGIVIVDSDTFTIVGIERDLEKFETRVKLHRVGRFNYSASAKGVDQIASAPPPTVVSPETTQNTILLECIADVEQFDIVAIGQETASRAEANHQLGTKPLGIALSAGLVGEYVQVQISGTIEMPGKLLSSGESLYVRTTTSPAWNAATDYSSLSSSETVLRKVGDIVREDTLQIRPQAPTVTSRGMLI